MRFYRYVSDTKVEMLFPQVPEATRGSVAKKIGFDLKLLSGSLETQEDKNSSLIARLQAVENHILDSELAGSVDERKPWIKGTANAKLRDVGDGAILYLSNENEHYLALGGSARHLIGNQVIEKDHPPFSFTHTLTQRLAQLAKDPELLGQSEDFLESFTTSGVSHEFEAWIDVIRYLSKHMPSEPEPIEYLARRLVSKPGPYGGEYTLATPLYVALQD